MIVLPFATDGGRAEPVLLHQHAVGNVDEHGARVVPTRIGLGPPLDPDGLAVVLATELEHDAARIRPSADRLERLLRGADEPRFDIFMDVGDWGFIEKIAEAFFAFAELIHCADPDQFGGGSGSTLPRPHEG